MRIAWSLPVRGERLDSTRGDVVRARHLVGALRALGHDVVVVEDAATARGAGSVRAWRSVGRRLLPGRLGLALRDAGRVLHAAAHARRVADAARAHRAELLVETQVALAPSGALAARRLGVPLVLDDCSPSREEVELGSGWPALARRTLRRQMRGAAAIVAVSGAIRDELVAEGADAARVRLVPNGVDLDAFARARAGRDAHRQALGIPDGACALVFVGSYQPWHAAERLAPVLAAQPQGVHLVLAGDGPGRSALTAALARAGLGGRVHDRGPTPSQDVPGLLAACDVGVLPGSNAHGHPMKLVEYGAAGLPAVAPDLAPVREVLAHGVEGLLCPDGDVDALAAAVRTLASDAALRHRLGAAALARSAGAGWTDRARALVEGFAP